MIEQWMIAQEAERRAHYLGRDEAIKHYLFSYAQYFKWLVIDTDLQGKTIAEIGPADVPALVFCSNRGKSFIVEPMPSDILDSFGLTVVKEQAEVIDFSDVDEVWLFNVLQHVYDLDIVIENVKMAKAVRWFEPVNQGTDECHLHNLTHEMFKEWFGESNVYKADPNAIRFHTAECSYGYFQSAR